MDVTDLKTKLNYDMTGRAMHDLVTRLYPICRSITGNGVRETLRIIGQQIPLRMREVPTGAKVLDWEVPKEWNIREAWIRDSGGRMVVDFAAHNLHVLNCSVPVKARMSLEELRPHLHSLPNQPELIPYRTSYYNETWGFCLTHRKLISLAEGEYEVFIDSSLTHGSLSYGECFLQGDTDEEFLITAHICHPSLANDNLSAVVTATFLARYLSEPKRRYSYRILFIPGTIGAITWLAQNEAHVHRVKHGLVLAGLGNKGPLVYKQSRRGDAVIDRAMLQALQESGVPFEVREFSPYGYDERQFCSPGFNLPVGRLGRTPHGEYPEYHTSADNLEFVKPDSMADALRQLFAVVEIVEGNRAYVNRLPKGEPQLGRRGLYHEIGGAPDAHQRELAMLWVLNYSDGDHDLIDIAERSGLPFGTIRDTAELLHAKGLLGYPHPEDIDE